MTIQVMTYSNETKILENVTAFDFDGETGILRYTDNISPYNTRFIYRIKNVEGGN